ETQLAALYRPIADELAESEAVFEEELRSPISFVQTLTRRIESYRGKRLRPALLLLTAKACGGVKPEHVTLAAVVEMVHTATLVHDDVLDEADVRRFVRTVNADWGNEASVLLGDYLFTHAFHLAASLPTTFGCRTIGRATNLVCEGELHQISERGVFELAEDEYIDILAGKTAELIACSCELGAHYADAPPRVVAAMASFGRNLGIAFQIADDLLDLLGDDQTTGKTTGSDLRMQKTTLPLIRFRQAASAEALERGRRRFDDPSVDQRERVRRLLNETDAVDYTRAAAGRFIHAALRDLNVLDESPAKKVLRTLAQFVVDRNA
ncbi:MAG: polyprenyl synthetase family protein, partial [Planctomycetia bacterium]